MMTRRHYRVDGSCCKSTETMAGRSMAGDVLYLSLSMLLFLYREGAALTTRLQEVNRRIAAAISPLALCC